MHNFNGQDGEGPAAALLMGPLGALYGVTVFAIGGYGPVFELAPPAGGSALWRYTVLYQLTTGAGSALVFGPGHSLYGVNEAGVVYSLSPPAAAGGGWTEATLYTFPGAPDSISPEGALAIGINGTLFGVTNYGGRVTSSCPPGCGTVYSLSPPAVSGAAWPKKLLYAFNPQIGDGYEPFAGVVIGADGVLYGTAIRGGASGAGTVFSLTPPAVPGAPMTETILHTFTGLDGSDPLPGVVLGRNGVLYGATYFGGDGGFGTVFELAPPASPGGSWTYTLLHSFTNGADGAMPNGLSASPNGTLYGTTNFGGAWAGGTVFAVAP